MSRKKKILVGAAIIGITVNVIAFYINCILGIIVLILSLLAVLAGLSLIVLNKLIKKTNWYKQILDCQKQFISNMGYRDNIQRNFEIANLGSNPALYGFFYENVKGMNWATGSQGLDMDFEILKYHHSILKKGAYVLIPIMPFSSISPFIKTMKGYWDEKYYAKFLFVTGNSANIPNRERVNWFMKYPILFAPKAIRYIIHDSNSNNEWYISEQMMQEWELEQHAETFIKSWLKEFNLKELNMQCLQPRFDYMPEAIKTITDMIDFCLERDLTPVLITIPMTKHLSNKFPKDVKKALVNDFIAKCNKRCVKVLDYSNCEEFTNDNLYKDSFFLNLRGRKLFTQRVLTDLGILCPTTMT